MSAVSHTSSNSFQIRSGSMAAALAAALCPWVAGGAARSSAILPHHSVRAAAATAPEAPGAVLAVASESGASIAWAAPERDGGSPITGYLVTVNPGGATLETRGTHLDLLGLENGQRYSFTVQARNALGESERSAPSAEVTPVAVPSAPTALQVIAGDGQATLSWNAPEGETSPVLGYTVTVHPGGATVETTGRALFLFGLRNGTGYSFTVHATNAGGDSPESSPSDAVMPMGSMARHDGGVDLASRQEG